MIGGPQPRGDRSPVRFDLTEASLEQYDAVLEHLREHGHYHELDGTVLTVQERHADEVRALLSDPSGSQALVIPSYLPVPPPRTRWSGGTSDLRTAPRLGRFIGAVIDAVVLGLVVWAASGMGGDGELGAALAVSLGFVLMTGFLGATPGKAIMRLQVEGPRGGAPGVPRAFVRWAVTVGPTVAAAALSSVSDDASVAVGMLGTLAVYVGVLVHSEGRGLHDLVAGTTVVRRRT